MTTFRNNLVKQPGASVEYDDCKGGRKIKRFDDCYAARRFYMTCLKQNRNPQIKRNES